MTSRFSSTLIDLTRPRPSRPAARRRVGLYALGTALGLGFTIGLAAIAQEPERPEAERGAAGSALSSEASPRSEAALRNAAAPYEPAPLAVWNREITVF